MNNNARIERILNKLARQWRHTPDSSLATVLNGVAPAPVLTELSDGELEQALDRAWERRFESEPSPQDVVTALEKARRSTMDLYGGNLDHPALELIEQAISAIGTTDYEIRKHRGGKPPGGEAQYNTVN